MCTIDRTCDICAYWSAAPWEQFVKKRSYIDRKKPSRPSGPVPPAPLASPLAETPSRVSQPGTSASSLSRPSGGQGKRRGGGGVSGCTRYCVPVGFLPSRWISVQQEGWECFWIIVCCARARSRFAGSFGSWRRGSCSVAADFPCPLRSSVVSHHSSPHARRRGELWETSEDRSRVLSSRGSRSSDRGARKDKRARSRLSSFRCPWPSFSLSLLFPFAVKRSRASRAVIVAVALCPCAVASRSVAVF